MQRIHLNILVCLSTLFSGMGGGRRLAKVPGRSDRLAASNCSDAIWDVLCSCKIQGIMWLRLRSMQRSWRRERLACQETSFSGSSHSMPACSIQNSSSIGPHLEHDWCCCRCGLRATVSWVRSGHPEARTKEVGPERSPEERALAVRVCKYTRTRQSRCV